MSPLMVPAATVMCKARSKTISATPANPKKSSKLMKLLSQGGLLNLLLPSQWGEVLYFPYIVVKLEALEVLPSYVASERATYLKTLTPSLLQWFLLNNVHLMYMRLSCHDKIMRSAHLLNYLRLWCSTKQLEKMQNIKKYWCVCG